MKYLLLAILLVASGCDDTRGMGDGGMVPSDGGMPTDGGGTDSGMVTPMSPLVDPRCTDGMFSETLPDPEVDISEIEASFATVDPFVFLEAILSERYSTGLVITAGGRDGFIDCVDTFYRDRSSPETTYRQLGVIVHECGHVFDISLSSGRSSTYVINNRPLRLTCSGGDTTSRGGQTFARSRIRGDTFQDMNPSDSYANVYLDGDPDDMIFEGGDQGFNSVMEEVVQYVNSLAVGYAFTNEHAARGGSVSERDGILTFLWYLMRYLRMARLDFPSAYAHILNGDGGCWRNLVLTVWGRAWLYLGVTEGMGHLGIRDDALMGLVTNPDLVSEIQLLRDAEGCPSP